MLSTLIYSFTLSLKNQEFPFINFYCIILLLEPIVIHVYFLSICFIIDTYRWKKRFFVNLKIGLSK